jgi:hypothetical protein
MIEGKDQQQIQAWAAEIAGAVREHLGWMNLGSTGFD